MKTLTTMQYCLKSTRKLIGGVPWAQRINVVGVLFGVVTGYLVQAFGTRETVERLRTTADMLEKGEQRPAEAHLLGKA